MAVSGEDRSGRLDIIPAQFRVLITRRPKLACRIYAGVVVQQYSSTAACSVAAYRGSIPAEGTVAHVLVARYADHCGA